MMPHCTSRRRRVALPIVFVLMALPAMRIAAEPEASRGYPSNEDLRHYGLMQDPQLSPDGKRVLVQIKDATADGGRSHLWSIASDGGPPPQLTFSPDADKEGESLGRWMPDGRSILFLAHRAARAELFRLPLEGAEARAF